MSGNARKGIPDNYLELLEQASTFVNGNDGHVYLMPKDGTRPVKVRSRAGQAFVLSTLGICRSTPKLEALWLDLEDHARNTAPVTRVETTAAFDPGRRELRVNLGGGKVFFMSAQEVRVEIAYTDRLLFVDEPGFRPVDSDAVLAAWGQLDSVNLPYFTRALLGSLPPSQEIALDPQEQQSVVLAWWLGAFLGDVAVARPILALVGPPACGKTVTGRQLGTAFYGSSYDVSGVAAGSRAEKDVAASLVERALVVRDDINNAPRGIMDLLCSAATGQKFDLSAFHETLALVSYRPRAILALTAHTPKWALREDVLSRLLVLRLALPPKSTVTERDRKEAALANRPGLWAETLMLLYYAVVASDDRFGVVSRFPDWEMAVRRGLRAVGREDALVNALRKMEVVRVRVASAAEPLLDALATFASGSNDPDGKPNSERWWTATDLYAGVVRCLGLPNGGNTLASRDLVRSASALGKFLSKLEGEGSAVVKIERRRGPRNAWLWRVTSKVTE